MRILVHDHSGHPFQAELSRELARRGHAVTHSYVRGYVSGKGRLEAGRGETVRFEGIGWDRPIGPQGALLRLARELARGLQLVRHVRKERPDVVLLSNVQIPTLVVFALVMAVLRRPWVLWHQDVYSVAVTSFVQGDKLSRKWLVVAWAFDIAERWCARRAAAIVVIAPSFVPVHEKWGTSDKVTVIPNWAPLEEIRPTPRHNPWSAEQGLDDVPTLVYAGTLGLKHNPALLVHLAHEARKSTPDLRLVVVNSGPAVEVIEAEAARLRVPVTLCPFQPYDRLPEVLGSGDVLVVLLDRSAGAFSVPSKTLSYLSAGRPILGLMPEENLAAALIERAGGLVLPPDEDSVDSAAGWVHDVLTDPARQDALGTASRALAEDEFALDVCADQFERLLAAQTPDAKVTRISSDVGSLDAGTALEGAEPEEVQR